MFVEQRPRQQSRRMVARPGLGQAVVFAVWHRPRWGARGELRVQLRHGVSAVYTGDRNVLVEFALFHDCFVGCAVGLPDAMTSGRLAG